MAVICIQTARLQILLDLAGDGVYSSYIYLTNEMIAGNSGIKTTVNKAYTTSSDNNSKYTFKGFYIGSKQLFNEKGEVKHKECC